MPSLNSAAFILISALAPVAALAQTAPIDRGLQGQLDFRVPAFGVCFEQTRCQVGGVTVEAFRQVGAGLDPAQIYWDPIDGFGVMGGGQNDEIDFDERLVITFDRPVTVSAVWVTDLFLGEAGRYGGQGSDAEVAQIDLSLDGTSRRQLVINGDTALPAQVFNSLVAADMFDEGGDLLQRVVVRDGAVELVGANGRRALGALGGDGGLGRDAETLFAGLPTTEIDTARLQGLIDGVVLFPAGTTNAGRMSSVLRNGAEVERIYAASATFRVEADLSNGEAAGALPVPQRTDRITLTSPFGTSNDYSIAGIVVTQ